MQAIEERQRSENALDADQRRQAASPRGPAVWSGVGFLAGAMLCGAAGLLSETAQGRAEAGPEEVLRGDTARVVHNNVETGSLPTIYVVSAANCTALEVNRQTNVTTARACPAEGLALRMEHARSRADMAALTSD